FVPLGSHTRQAVSEAIGLPSGERRANRPENSIRNDALPFQLHAGADKVEAAPPDLDAKLAFVDNGLAPVESDVPGVGRRGPHVAARGSHCSPFRRASSSPMKVESASLAQSAVARSAWWSGALSVSRVTNL